MSGSRHHVVPQFILREFASHSIGDAAYAWVYRKDRLPFNSNIINIAVEGHFYTQDESADVDDHITAEESELARIVDNLRRTGSVEGFSSETLAKLVSHLESRTRHLRRNFENLGNAILTRTLEFIADEKLFSEFIIRHVKREPEAILARLSAMIRGHGIAEDKVALLIDNVRPQLPALLPSMLPSLMREFTSVVQHVAKEQPRMIKAAARSGQLRALLEDVAPEAKVARYSGLQFTVLNCQDKLLPLGDSAVLARIDAPRQYTTFVGADDFLLSMFLPLSPTAVLCGHIPEYLPSVNELPLAIVRCSLEYYIGHERSTAFEQYQPRLGELASVVDNEVVERLLIDAFNE